MNIFNFSDISKSEATIQRTWDEFRSDLANGDFTYDDFNNAKSKTIFFKVFDDMFSNCHHFFDVSIDAVLSQYITLIRAGRLKPEDPEPTYSRFIPDKNFINAHNRFSPPKVEWLYLAIGDIDNAETCALKECRASSGEIFGLCKFILNKDFVGKKLVDFTIADNTQYNDINNQLEMCAEEVCKRKVNEFKRKGYTHFTDTDEIKDTVLKWVAFTYARLLSKQIFLPVETKDKELMYAPFQCIAQYLLSLGYEGIVYSSTVFPKGKNVVLFDKDAAIPTGKIKIIKIK